MLSLWTQRATPKENIAGRTRPENSDVGVTLRDSQLRAPRRLSGAFPFESSLRQGSVALICLIITFWTWDQDGNAAAASRLAPHPSVAAQNISITTESAATECIDISDISINIDCSWGAGQFPLDQSGGHSRHFSQREFMTAASSQRPDISNGDRLVRAGLGSDITWTYVYCIRAKSTPAPIIDW